MTGSPKRAAGACLAAWAVLALCFMSVPAPAQAQQTECTLAGDDLLTDAYVNAFGWVLATPTGAFNCLNKVEVNYDFAVESVKSIAKIFNQSYVFVSLAARPQFQQPLSTIIWRYGIDLPNALNNLTAAWTPGEPVPLADLYFATNNAFNSLYDAHVSFAGSGDNGGTFLGDAVRNLTRVPRTAANQDTVAGDGMVYLVDVASGDLLVQVDVARDDSGNYTVRGRFLDPAGNLALRTFDQIQGGSPWEWFVGISLNPALALTFKPPGTRVNQLLASFKQYSGFFIRNMGNISTLPKPPVVYSDGTTSQLQWGVTFAPTVTAARLALAQQLANSPGTPYKALQKALNVLENVTVSATTAEAESQPIHKPPLVEERRRLQVGGGGSSSRLTYINDTDTDKAYAFYYFNGTKAVLKLSTFSFTGGLDALQKWWPKFISDAGKAGATTLILDLTGNPGGDVQSGIGMLLTLYSSQKYGEFNLRYDRIMGEDAVYAYANGLSPDSVNATIQGNLANPVLVQARIAQLASNPAEVQRLIRKTRTVISALNVLLSSVSKDQTQLCQTPDGGAASCAAMWSSVGKQVLALIDAIQANALSVENLRSLAGDALPVMAKIMWPYWGVVEDDGTDPYAEPQSYYRGGYWRNYTSKFDLLGLSKSTTYKDFFPSLKLSKPPFTKILALSDGYCGSTCDTFSRSAWFYSRKHPEAPVFRYLTFGGTGRFEDSSATAYPGGNVDGNNFLSAAHAYAILGNLTADWLGWEGLDKTVQGWSELLPSFPAFLDHYTPSYTLSEVYQQGSLGNYLPSEYLKIPTDIWLPVWYQSTGMPTPGESSDLPALYAVAATVLESLPSLKTPGIQG